VTATEKGGQSGQPSPIGGGSISNPKQPAGGHRWKGNPFGDVVRGDSMTRIGEERGGAGWKGGGEIPCQRRSN